MRVVVSMVSIKRKKKSRAYYPSRFPKKSLFVARMRRSRGSLDPWQQRRKFNPVYIPIVVNPPTAAWRTREKILLHHDLCLAAAAHDPNSQAPVPRALHGEFTDYFSISLHSAPFFIFRWFLLNRNFVLASNQTRTGASRWILSSCFFSPDCRFDEMCIMLSMITEIATWTKLFIYKKGSTPSVPKSLT